MGKIQAIRKPGLSTKNILDREKFYGKALNFGINNVLNNDFPMKCPIEQDNQ